MTICCLKPNCSNPENPNGTKFCVACRTPITILRNRYRPLRLLSDEGGFGRTYLAEDLDGLKAKCVIKQLCPQKQGTAVVGTVEDLFEDEARQLQQLGEHPQIPNLLAYFQENNYLYLVQQYIEGKTLDKLYNRCWSETEVKEFLNNILPIFEFIHERKVIHRDIKPSNIMQRDSDGQYILIDFGASKDFAVTVATRGTRIGTQGYAAYEQMESGEAFKASDLFSLGVTCFVLLTGVDPYKLFLDKGYQWVNQWQTHLQQPLSDQFRQVLNKLLQKDRQNRYQSATDVLSALQTIAQQKQSQDPSFSSPTIAQQKQSENASSQPQPVQPTQLVTRSQPQQQNRRKFLQYLGYGGIGVVAVWFLSLLRNRNSSDIPIPIGIPSPVPTIGRFPLEPFSFETVKVDSEGKIIQREMKEGKQFTVDLGNDVFLDMVQIAGGTFMMGSPETEDGRQDNEAQQQITVDNFYIGKYEVTQEQWQAIMGNNPSYFNKGDKYPLENVSWDDCQEFCQKLSEKTELTFTLPTEAQWEYACRAGTDTPFYYGETLSKNIANYEKKGIYRGETTKVGSFPANGFGLYDMHGNVWEWCQDNYHKNYHKAVNKVTANPAKLVFNPSRSPLLDTKNSQLKSLRGGGWNFDPTYSRSAMRFYYDWKDNRDIFNGFRVVYMLFDTKI
ncbi:MAG: SUMF1/EgtB/PvdO family nonheme iron enzyme [Crocosphaera sp.]